MTELCAGGQRPAVVSQKNYGWAWIHLLHHGCVAKITHGRLTNSCTEMEEAKMSQRKERKAIGTDWSAFSLNKTGKGGPFGVDLLAGFEDGTVDVIHLKDKFPTIIDADVAGKKLSEKIPITI